MKSASLHLGKFAARVEKAKTKFHFGVSLNPSDWIAFYEAKLEAYEDLCVKIPQVKEIPDFWRWVQNSGSLDWIGWTEREILRLTNSAKCPCGVKLKWPKKLCEKCLEDRKLKAKQSKKTRKAVRKRVNMLSQAKKAPRNHCNQKI